MNADERKYLDELSNRVIGAAFEVSNTLGAGFLEKVYRNALALELELRGIQVETEKCLRVQYKGREVGDYFADLIVEQRLPIELKCAEYFAPEHLAQCLNYLKATGWPLLLLMNFQKPKVEIKRIVHNF